MSTGEGPLLSVRGAATRAVPPDAALLLCQVIATRETKAAALADAAAALDRLTGALAGFGGVPLDATTGRRPLVWSARSAATQQARDPETGQVSETRVAALVDVVLTVRDFAVLDPVGAALADHEAFAVHWVDWRVDDDNPEWPLVRADAIRAAVRKARDYAAALGGSLLSVEHVADTGLLATGGDHREPRMAFASGGGYGGRPAAPSLDPVPQDLTATVEARFTAGGVTLADL